MTFKEELVSKLREARLARVDTLEEDISMHIGDRYYSVDLRLGEDVVYDWMVRHKFLPSGQAIWDKLVSLGFEPVYEKGSLSFEVGHNICIRW
jgi:hypothetical protein